jgi:hypothetical protein
MPVLGRDVNAKPRLEFSVLKCRVEILEVPERSHHRTRATPPFPTRRTKLQKVGIGIGITNVESKQRSTFGARHFKPLKFADIDQG